MFQINVGETVPKSRRYQRELFMLIESISCGIDLEAEME